jgi:hypothetical protein
VTDAVLPAADEAAADACKFHGEGAGGNVAAIVRCRGAFSGRQGSGTTGKFGAASSASQMSTMGRNDSSASGSLPASTLQRRLSGDESDRSAVAARPIAELQGARLDTGKQATQSRIQRGCG